MIINSGASLQLAGAGDRVNDSAAFSLNGGTLSTAGLSETVGTLALGASSIADLGNGNSILHFANSSTKTWSGFLNIYDWTGNPVGGGTDQIYFGSDSTGLTNGQLSEIRFYSGNGTGFLGTGSILSDGEVVPDLAAVPEPSTLAAAFLLGGALLWRERRRLRQSL